MYIYSLQQWRGALESCRDLGRDGRSNPRDALGGYISNPTKEASGHMVLLPKVSRMVMIFLRSELTVFLNIWRITSRGGSTPP